MDINRHCKRIEVKRGYNMDITITQLLEAIQAGYPVDIIINGESYELVEDPKDK